MAAPQRREAQHTDDSISMLEHALRYAATGLPIFPVHSIRHDGLCSCGNRKCTDAGKHPRVRGGFYAATTDEKQIRKWWREWPTTNIGMRTGAGILIIDVDTHSDGADGYASLQRLTADHAPVPSTRTSHSGGGGAHLWYRYPQGVEIPSKANVIAGYPGIDIRADKGYILLPPSNHKSGNFYAWLTAPDAEIADLPQWFIELVKPAPHPEMELEHEAEMPQSGQTIDWDKPRSGEFWVNHYAAKAHPGERDDCMALLALQLRDSAGLNFVQAEPYARMYARTVTQSGDPYDEERAVKTLRSILLSPLHGKRQPAKRRNAPSAKSAAKSVSMAGRAQKRQLPPGHVKRQCALGGAASRV